MEPHGTDSAHPVRAGEELDADALRACFATKLPEAAGELSVAQFPSGHSNLTYLVTVGDREFVLRRPPFGFKAIRAGHDMLREYRILDGLRGVYTKAPRPFFFCPEEDSPFGAPFYVMERVRGT